MKKPDAGQPEFKPCPFCGAQPEPYMYVRGDLDEVHMIKCTNQNCLVQPSVYFDEGDRVGPGKAYDLDEMRKAWNGTRPDLPAATPGEKQKAWDWFKENVKRDVDRQRIFGNGADEDVIRARRACQTIERALQSDERQGGDVPVGPNGETLKEGLDYLDMLTQTQFANDGRLIAVWLAGNWLLNAQKSPDKKGSQ